MATNARDARRRRILQGGQDRLNPITGRVQNISSTDSQSTIPDISVACDEDTYTAGRAQSPPLVSQDFDPTPHYPPAGGKVQLLIFILFGVVFFAGFLYAAVVSKLLPPSTNPILSAIQKDSPCRLHILPLALHEAFQTCMNFQDSKLISNVIKCTNQRRECKMKNFVDLLQSKQVVFVDAGVAPIDIETKKKIEEMKLKEQQARALAEHGELALIAFDCPKSDANERISLRPPMLQVVRLASFQHAPSIPPFLTLPKASKTDGDESSILDERRTNEFAVGGSS